MAVMAKWRNKTFEVSRKKVNPLKNFSTSTTIKGDDSKSKKKKTELVPFTFDIDVHANAGVNPQKEYESWCSLIKSTGVLYLHGRRFGRETRLKEVSLSGVIMDDYGRIRFATIGLTFEEVNKKETSGKSGARAAASEAKKAEKAAKKAAEEAEANALFEQAVQALKNKDFVLEADRIEFKRGSFVYVTPNTNFVSVKGEKATIQLAFNTPAAGPNGIGGITVDGTTSGVQMKTDKKGNVMYEMNVQGVAVSARVTFRMAKGTNKCTATVSPNFNSNRISFTGNLYPSSESNVFKGRSFGKPAFLFIRRMRLDYFQASFCTR